METQKDAIEEREKRDKAARHQLDILDKTGQASFFPLICVHAFVVLFMTGKEWQPSGTSSSVDKSPWKPPLS